MEQTKRSFFGSVMDGIKGSFKGALAGGAVGALAGAAVGAVIALVTLGAGLAFIPGLAILGAAVMGSIGSTAGTITGVVKGREGPQITQADVQKVAKIAFAQGVHVGQSMEPEQTKFRSRIDAERAAAEQAQSQRVH